MSAPYKFNFIPKLVSLWFGMATFCMAHQSIIDAFPEAGDGMERHVIILPERDDSDDLKVELIVGKTIETDGVNRYFYGGGLIKETLQGWGYSYYKMEELGPLGQTRIGVRGDQEPVEAFVRTTSETLIGYNARMPVVVYLPEGVELRYRIWQAGPVEFVPPRA